MMATRPVVVVFDEGRWCVVVGAATVGTWECGKPLGARYSKAGIRDDFVGIPAKVKRRLRGAYGRTLVAVSNRVFLSRNRLCFESSAIGKAEACVVWKKGQVWTAQPGSEGK
jgi:hypothetical protein